MQVTGALVHPIFYAPMPADEHPQSATKSPLLFRRTDKGKQQIDAGWHKQQATQNDAGSG